ncbi:glycosyltransferase family protein [Limnobacter parvus]|uniref:Glycosyltransferase n=1 Tax=Limnobacter parvus TaxID=2939690 RepID=A0ABT1XD56_9BURK|nr:glycosyltransferase [Limnobacter parvus]MCR2745213.1 glycosyltransferase [Limnobacter parvus]
MRKVIVHGTYIYPIYEDALVVALRKVGYLVISDKVSLGNSIFTKFQLRFNFLPSPLVIYLSINLFFRIIKGNPNVVFLWKAFWIHPIVLRILKFVRPGCQIIIYNNDNPYSSLQNPGIFDDKYLVRYFRQQIKYADNVLVYRWQNVEEAKAYGAVSVLLFPSYYLPWIDLRTAPTLGEYTGRPFEVCFVGHYECDGRIIYLKEINSLFKLILGGGNTWTANVLDEINYYDHVCEHFGDQYIDLLSKSKICLCFLSKHNKDEYTRRCFEIPASGNLLLVERTKYLESIFVDFESALFFSSVEEAIQKIYWALSNQSCAHEILLNGQAVVIKGNFSVFDRVRQVINPPKVF